MSADKNVLYSIRPTVYRSAIGWTLLHLEAVHEAATSDVAAGRRSGSLGAIGRRNLLSQMLFQARMQAASVAANALACATKDIHHENTRNLAG
jgi:hypothetical protein